MEDGNIVKWYWVTDRTSKIANALRSTDTERILSSEGHPTCAIRGVGDSTSRIL